MLEICLRLHSCWRYVLGSRPVGLQITSFFYLYHFLVDRFFPSLCAYLLQSLLFYYCYLRIYFGLREAMLEGTLGKSALTEPVLLYQGFFLFLHFHSHSTLSNKHTDETFSTMRIILYGKKPEN